MYLTDAELESLSIGQEIGIYDWHLSSDRYVKGTIIKETAKYWIVSSPNVWGQPTEQKFRKIDGKGYGSDRRLCSLDSVKEYQEEKLKQHYQEKAIALKCQYSPEFQQDLIDLISKHKKVK